MRALLGLVVLLAASGCASPSSLAGFHLPSEARQKGIVFSVKHQPKDERRLDKAIAAVLQSRGIDAVTDPEVPADYVVSYVDRWYWDMRMYLVDLRIDVREPENDVLVATGRSYQTSLAALGSSHQDIIEKVVDVIIEGIDARMAEQTKQREEQRRRRKR
jgi:hypothetical protein